ncbi:hypothetical protein CFHF_08030 [Caulobacter flavus]|uniref:Right handed beta helix domain-containing protein n=1 Tax=Caulobacter flavus TaxID=1679497 RepID=A0A2N5CVF4_9CAUL|nr:hypothetical protein [Caulobacter flavus]AYV46858.1 hypothetical protein C1707_11615 [Caulobacter flavus]PLR17766.1 hypothetical protein CFHF_08030 [Caulobacter flavus]
MPTINAPAPNGVDDHAVLQALVDHGRPYGQFTTDGVEIALDRGVYRLSQSLDLSNAHGVHIRGQGMHTTEMRALGDFSVIRAEGSPTEPLNQAGIKGLTIRGFGNDQPGSYGIMLKWTNRCAVEDVLFFSCMLGMVVSHAWQTKLTNLQATGGGADRCRHGVYMSQSSSEYIDNAVIATGCTMQDCIETGFRIVNGQGSKFTACEAGGTKYGWYIGDTTGGVKNTWLHIDNCLADTAEIGWLIQSDNDLGEMILCNLWTGNCTEAGMVIRNAKNLQVNGVIAISHHREAVRLEGCQHVSLSQVSAKDYNRIDVGAACIRLTDSQNCTVSNVNAVSIHPTTVARETGTSDRNLLSTLTGKPELIGANSRFSAALDAPIQVPVYGVLPSTAPAGQLAYDSGTGKLVFSNGAAWIPTT